MPYVVVTAYDRRDVQTSRDEEFYPHTADALDEYAYSVQAYSFVKGSDVSEFKQPGWRRTTVSMPDGTAVTVETDA